MDKPNQAFGVGSSPKRPRSRGEWNDSACFEIGARIDSFAAVLTMLSRSSMHKLSVANQER
jgi:hypothetical protein